MALTSDSHILLLNGDSKSIEDVITDLSNNIPNYTLSITDTGQIIPTEIIGYKKLDKAPCSKITFPNFYEDDDNPTIIVNNTALFPGYQHKTDTLNLKDKHLFPCRFNMYNDSFLDPNSKMYLKKEFVIKNEYDMFDDRNILDIISTDNVIEDFEFISSMTNNRIQFMYRACMDHMFRGLLGVEELYLKELDVIMKHLSFEKEDTKLEPIDLELMYYLWEFNDTSTILDEIDKDKFKELSGLECDMDNLNKIAVKLGYSNIGHITSSQDLHCVKIANIEEIGEFETYQLILERGKNVAVNGGAFIM